MVFHEIRTNNESKLFVESPYNICIPHKIQDLRNQRGIGGGSSRDWESRNCEMRSRSSLSLSLSYAWQNGRRTEIVGRNKAKKRNDRSLRVLWGSFVYRVHHEVGDKRDDDHGHDGKHLEKNKHANLWSLSSTSIIVGEHFWKFVKWGRNYLFTELAEIINLSNLSRYFNNRFIWN